jgi:hypothetical protein
LQSPRACGTNVDLEVRSKHDLAQLAKGFEPRALALSCMPVSKGYFANFEPVPDPIEPDAGIRRFLKLIAKLPPRARRLWKTASKRDFSIGVLAGSSPFAVELALSPVALKLIADVAAGITFVVYARGPAATDALPGPPTGRASKGSARQRG